MTAVVAAAAARPQVSMATTDTTASSRWLDDLHSQSAGVFFAHLMQRLAVLRECETGLLTQLVLKLRPSAFGPGDYVCRKGDIGKGD